MNKLTRLRLVLADKEVERHQLYQKIPRWAKRKVASMHGTVHPWLELSQQYPHVYVLEEYAQLLLRISELEGDRIQEEEVLFPPPNLSLNKIRRSS
jgi:hypothetical protein